MGTVYRPTFSKPLPAGAEVFTRQGERFARWKDRAGKTRTAPLTTGRDGADRLLVEARTFVAKYRDGAGIVRTTATGCRDETAARRVLADLERRAELVKAGVMTAGEDSVADHQGIPLDSHFRDYLDHQEVAGVSPARIKDTRYQLGRIARDCGFRTLRDLDAGTFERWLTRCKNDGMAAGTRNRYRESLVGFTNWCVAAGRLLVNPVANVPLADVKTERKRLRRAMSEGELCRLLDAARRRPLVDMMTVRRGTKKGEAVAELRDDTRRRLERLGYERALIYKTYLLTGLRKSELASLTVGQLDLDADPPFLTLDAADEKNRQGNSLPLRADLAAELREWLVSKAVTYQDAARKALTVKLDSEAVQAGKRGRRDSVRRQGQACQQATGLPPDAPVFTVPTGLLRILNRDLAFAGIPKVDERGRTVDVHALRHSFGTHLSRAGVPPRTAQAAMRHSSVDLTMNVYTDPRLLDVSGAINRLPHLPLDGSLLVERRSEAATGTDGKPDSPPQTTGRKLVPKLVPTADVSGVSGSFPGNSPVDARDVRNAKSTEKTSVFPMLSEVGGIGVEPTTSTMSTWRSNQLS